MIAIGVPTVVGAAAIVQDTISALLAVLEENECAKGTGSWIRQMDTEGQYELIRELLEPEFGPMYVTPPDIDQSVQQLSFTISEGIHRAVFEPVIPAAWSCHFFFVLAYHRIQHFGKV